jgi:hypothetical protein
MVREALGYRMDSTKVLLHRSVADIPEPELVAQLVEDKHWWLSNVLEIRDIPRNSLACKSVPLAGLPGEPEGDVDILLWVPGRVDEAIAIQVKRIKVGIKAVRTCRPNKLHEFEVGVRQANLLARLGFSQVYLWVFVVVDTREQNAGQITYAGLGPELYGKISGHISSKDLDPRIGLIHYELIQPMDNVPLKVGVTTGHLRQLAKSVAQPAELTLWVDKLKVERSICSNG